MILSTKYQDQLTQTEAGGPTWLSRANQVHKSAHSVSPSSQYELEYHSIMYEKHQ